MKYITLFETATAFEAARATLDLPNVSLIEATNGINYLPYVSTPSHEYVEIGGVKWATMNIGANSITDYGLYFQWADTQGYTAEQVGNGEGQKHFGWTDYKYSNNGGSTAAAMTKYNSTDGKTVLESTDDAATAAWGSGWRMPTDAEFNELKENTNYEWTTINGVNGGKFTSKTDGTKYVFFPAAGYCNDGTHDDAGSYSYIWSSTLNSSNVINGMYLNFSSGGRDMDYVNRCLGFSVRGVLDNSNS